MAKDWSVSTCFEHLEGGLISADAGFRVFETILGIMGEHYHGKDDRDPQNVIYSFVIPADTYEAAILDTRATLDQGIGKLGIRVAWVNAEPLPPANEPSPES